MAVNKPIVIGTIGIVGVGIVNAATKHEPITPIVMGGYVIALLASVVDLAGGQASTLMGGLVMLTFLSVLITQGPWDAINRIVNPNTTPGGAPPPTKR